MKKQNIFITILYFIIILWALALAFVFARHMLFRHAPTISSETEKAQYSCPMHPDFKSDKPGSCSICGMDLVKKQPASQPQKTGQKKLLYYRNPMDPEVTSPVPMKDSMGMDYVPVYEQESGTPVSGITMSQDKQQLIGVKKETIHTRPLTYEILTVGKVAYDPDLYIAQEEYLQALKTSQTLKTSVLTSAAEQADSFVNAAQRKLLLLGMTETQIQELAKQGEPEENLYLPLSSDTVWVYMTVYEYEIGLVKEGQDVSLDTAAFPGEVFKGKIMALTPVLNAENRSLQVRAQIDDPGHKLKPRMFVNAKIAVNLGEKLAVPEEAVLDTGMRKIVYVSQENDILEPREVTLGSKAQGYYEVLNGLKEGDAVVISGNFLVDSESKLKGVTPETEHQHGP